MIAIVQPLTCNALAQYKREYKLFIVHVSRCLKNRLTVFTLAYSQRRRRQRAARSDGEHAEADAEANNVVARCCAV